MVENKYWVVYDPESDIYSRLMEWEDADKIWRSKPGLILACLEVIVTYKLGE